ncbi:MAG: glycosyltransferase family 2 protein [Caldilinea sp.]|nr:glycosyltransferase family 2 protein [Caldilinea sp.]
MVALAVAAVLLVFNVRRLVFLAAAAFDLTSNRPLRPQSPGSADDSLPEVLVLAPMRNEARSLPELVKSLLALDYPTDRLTIGLIDDASTDGSGAAMAALAAAHRQVRVLHNPTSLGKADSLNAGLACWPSGELVAIYDADARPARDSLRRIVAAFADPSVAAAGGMIRPANGLASLTASYAAIERLVHQQVTMRAKDRLDLTPAILGSNCAYRRSDLVAAGGFPGGAFLEDSHLTVAFARQGRRTRFLPEALALDQVPETLGGYWRQHVRWGRGFVDVAAGVRAGGSARRLKPASDTGKPAEAGWESDGFVHERRPSLAQRVELTLFSLGYLDRLALLAGVGLTAGRRVLGRHRRADDLLAGMLLINVLLPYAQIATTLVAERASLAWWRRVAALPAFFVVDAAAAFWSTVLSVSHQPRMWQPTERT